jgi:DHA1 family tetracycline resistance protein-like MFS transporter
MAQPFLKRLKGNARGCLLFEPLFLIPYSMFSTYATIYMFQMGVSETAIGWITSIGLIVQVFSSFISGYLTDRMGRKAALLYFDILSWSVATLLWAMSQNVWFFVAAAIVNGFQRVPHTAFYCLLVEDTPPQERTYVFTVLQFIGVVGGLFAPLGGLLVYHYSLIPGVRILFIFAFVCMTIQFFGRQYHTHETDMGIRKMREVRGMSVKAGLGEYINVIRSMLSNPPLLIVFGVYILFNFQMTMKNTYLSLYLVDYLRMGDGFISIFPAISSVIMLLVMWLLLPRIGAKYIHRVMIWGFVVSLLSNVLLIIALPGELLWLSISIVLAAAGTIMTLPYLEAAVANAIDDEQRANVFAILSVLILVFITPSGIIGGWAYKIDPRIPFLFVALAFLVSMLLMVAYQKKTTI